MRLTGPLKPVLTFRGFRQQLASIDAVPSFAFLVDIAGIVTCGPILLLGGLIVMLSDPEGFKMLGSLSRFSSFAQKTCVQIRLIPLLKRRLTWPQSGDSEGHFPDSNHGDVG